MKPPAESLYTAMRFAACTDVQSAIDEVWQELHDDLIATFPTQRRSPVQMRLYRGEHAIGMLDDIERSDAVDHAHESRGDYATLRSEIARLGLFAVVSVDVAMALS